jgi:hypothetical protein
MFKEFTVRDILPPINIKKYAKKPETKGNIPFVSCQTTNNGIATYCGETPEVNHCITVSTNGNCFDCFWHNYPIIPSSDVEVLHKDGITDDEKISLYLCGLLAPNTHLYSYSNKPKNGKVFNTKLFLPVIENSNPDHEYTVDDIDWQYMRDYITELEHEHITELEQERITELDAYLQATGLNDYELTEDDKKILSLSAKRTSDEDGTLEDDNEDEIRFGEFKIDTLFHKVNLKRLKKTFEKDKDLSREQTSEYSLPLINAKNGDNGIMYYGRPEDWESDTYCIDIVNDGAISTGNVYPQPQRTGVLYNAYMIKPNVNIQYEAILMYLSKSIEKIIKEQFGYDNKATWDKVKVKHIYLPIKSDGTPDFDYMERYIRAMEKVVIADVVKYKDKVIEETRKVVGI